jgi:carbonic anhydrase
MKFAGHFDANTFPKWYAHPISDVDGLATFLNIPGRSAHIKNHRSMAVHYDPHMLQSLPAKQMFEFEARDDIRKLTADIKNSRLEFLREADDSKKQLLLNRRRQLETQKSRAYHNELARLRKADTGGSKNKFQETLFHYHRRVMPERHSLAEILPTSVELRSLDGRKALCALEALCVQERRVVYQSALAPKEGKCVCGEKMSR